MDVKGSNTAAADFSSYILFEASGDSEEPDFDHNNMVCEVSRVGSSYVHHGDHHHHGDDAHYDDDDALSCSCDRSDDDDDDACNVAEANWDHDDDEEEEEDVVYGTSYCEEDDEVVQEQQHPKSFDSNQESLDEMEKNRLFWEACLAS
ncbi:hypothetical protein PIB30_043664 [Stylosanthes scabra]|uniref:Uncharacterized protein n=1 Tax=Stylosanthes scabra TaxID=79078 RepID=A0ABU6ZEC4_9FABA|nr:hypothetical protein [Stylosanthes scabra]